jgi:uncharacterized protein (TIGR02646 family)
MRTVRKRAPPAALQEWRLRRLANPEPGNECTYDELRRDREVMAEVERRLCAEQGGLCAYTGHRVRVDDTPDGPVARFHVEHLRPQRYCTAEHDGVGRDTEYGNMVACWPPPNVTAAPQYGAVVKADWPSPSEEPQFVGPLRADCSARFEFGRSGEMRVARTGDEEARETIRRLNLDVDRAAQPRAIHPLAEVRRAAIAGALHPRGKPITAAKARRLLRALELQQEQIDGGQDVELMEFCFAVLPAVRRKVKQHEGIARTKRR